MSESNLLSLGFLIKVVSSKEGRNEEMNVCSLLDIKSAFGNSTTLQHYIMRVI